MSTELDDSPLLLKSSAPESESSKTEIKSLESDIISPTTEITRLATDGDNSCELAANGSFLKVASTEPSDHDIATPDSGNSSDSDSQNLFGDQEVSDEDANDVFTEHSVEVKVIEATIPTETVKGLKGTLYYQHIPSFLKIEPQHYDRQAYIDSVHSSNTLDEKQGVSKSTMLSKTKLRVDNVIRWRRNPENPIELQSNTQLIEWDDGSYSLQVGKELYNVEMHDYCDENAFSTITHESAEVLCTEKQFSKCISIVPNQKSQLTFPRVENPTDYQSAVREVVVDQDPDKVRREAENAEIEMQKARKRLETKRKAVDRDFSSARFFRRQEYKLSNDLESLDEAELQKQADRLNAIKKQSIVKFQSNDESDDADFRKDESESDQDEQSSMNEELQVLQENSSMTPNTHSNESVKRRRVLESDEE